ncbi:phosphotransferase [Acrocarpospora catenulata]|uniref:phosphotransferase n=1 Tax=Acrocarpospora catenulata TaxID=2836182 RepID=UPI001BDA4DB7|nr:phosphotransferase [Acrocarpospora catenulata]
MHGDLRADNMLISGGRVLLVDWAHATRGAAWQDHADLIPHLIMAGHDPDQALKIAFPGRQPAWETLAGYAAAYAGYWLRMSREPAPAGVPHLRGYQRRPARAALAWLHALTGPLDDDVPIYAKD